jgi:hypothetical protein
VTSRIVFLVTALLGTCALAGSTAAVVDPGGQTVAAGAFRVQWSPTDPEEIVDLSWNGSPNLTNVWTHAFCPQGGDSEFFGNSWSAQGGTSLRTPVGWGSTGTWRALGDGAMIDSAASGCFGTTGLPVRTSYHFFAGAHDDHFRVQRRFSVGSEPLTVDLRPYIPRLYPRNDYSVVIHPNADGTALVTEIGNACEFGCQIANWNDTWFAIHDPVSGRGMIDRHGFSPDQVALWVDMDGGSQTASSSVILLAPPGGFTGTLADTETFCFYDSAGWSPSLALPSGC